MSSSLQQVARQVSYLTYELQHLPSGGGIQTINNVDPSGNNITIQTDPNNTYLTTTNDPSGNTITIGSNLFGETGSSRTTFGLNAAEQQGNDYYCCFGANSANQYAGLYGTYVGYSNSQNGGNYSTSIGANTNPQGDGGNSVSIGFSTNQNASAGQYSIAIGQNAGAYGTSAIAIGTNVQNTTASSFAIAPVRQVPGSLTNLLSYNPSTYEISYATGVISLIGQTISNATVASWNNGSTFTIMPNRKYQLTAVISTNYNPTYSSPNPPPFVGFNLSLYTSSRYYGVTLGNPSSTNNFIISTVSPQTSSGGKANINACCNYSDIFDLSADSSTSANVAFYFIDWDNTNISSLNYSILLTPIA
jgi:hypothetical protein